MFDSVPQCDNVSGPRGQVKGDHVTHHHIGTRETRGTRHQFEAMRVDPDSSRGRDERSLTGSYVEQPSSAEVIRAQPAHTWYPWRYARLFRCQDR